ncbi:MAG: nitroreductase family protein [Emergencia sp.]
MLEKSKKLLEESRRRRTYRKFLPDPIDMEVIKNCVLTAGTAPSGADKQPWHFSIVTDPAMKQRIREESEKVEKNFYDNMITEEWQADLNKLSVNWEKPFLTEAPCLIVIFKEYYSILEDGTKDKNYYVNESIGIAMGMLINAIRNAGLVSLTYTPAPPTFLRELLGRPEGETPVMVLVVGKPDPDYELPVLKKKTFEEIADII